MTHHRFIAAATIAALTVTLSACSNSNPVGNSAVTTGRGGLAGLSAEIEFASHVATTDPSTRTLTFTTSGEIVVAAGDAQIVRRSGGGTVETPIAFEGIRVGDSVEVRGSRQLDGTVLANRIRVRAADGQDADLEFKSIIVSINYLDSSFTVRDRSETIRISAGTQILGHVRGGASTGAGDGSDDGARGDAQDDGRDTSIAFDALVVGDSVEVKALIVDAATLMAVRVDLEADAAHQEVEFRDVLASVDMTTGTVTFVAQSWIGQISESAQLYDLAKNPVALSAFTNGQLVEVKGYPLTGDTLLVVRMAMDNN